MTHAGGLRSALWRFGLAALLVAGVGALWTWMASPGRGVSDPDAHKDPIIACADMIESVPFASNSVALPVGSPGEAAVNRAAAFIRTRSATRAEPCRVASVEIMGHADARGSSAYNLALSRRRAAAVRQLLEAYLRRGSGGSVPDVLAPVKPEPSCGVVRDHAGQALSVYEAIEICHDGAGETHASQGVMTPEQWERDRRAQVTVRLRLKPFKRGLVTETPGS